jgi:hypothetical protein
MLGVTAGNYAVPGAPTCAIQRICRSVAAGVTYAVAAGNESDNAPSHIPAAQQHFSTGAFQRSAAGQTHLCAPVRRTGISINILILYEICR